MAALTDNEAYGNFDEWKLRFICQVICKMELLRRQPPACCRWSRCGGFVCIYVYLERFS